MRVPVSCLVLLVLLGHGVASAQEAHPTAFSAPRTDQQPFPRSSEAAPRALSYLVIGDGAVEHAHEAHPQRSRTRSPVQQRRLQFAGAGAVIGGAAGLVYCFNAVRPLYPFGWLAGTFLSLVGVPGGMALGGAAGYGVGLVLVH